MFCGEELAFDVLITDAVDYCDGDLYVLPTWSRLITLLPGVGSQYTDEEREVSGEMPRVFIKVVRKPVCDEVAECILRRRKARGEENRPLTRIAEIRGWVAPGARTGA